MVTSDIVTSVYSSEMNRIAKLPINRGLEDEEEGLTKTADFGNSLPKEGSKI